MIEKDSDIDDYKAWNRGCSQHAHAQWLGEGSGMSRDRAPDIVLIMGIRMKGVKGIQSEKKRQLIY